jgi:ABC-type molybdate transport system ATPase subunit
LQWQAFRALRPAAGGGKVVDALAEAGYSYQARYYALYPHLTVYKNMAFGLKLRRVAKDEIDRRVHGAVKILGIENLLERKPKALSGGQRQQVAVGRAIVRRPQAFLFAEPLGSGQIVRPSGPGEVVMVCKLDARVRVAIDQRMEVRLDLARIHLFDDQTGCNVTLEPEHVAHAS